MVERDAVLLHWYGGFGAPRLATPPGAEELVRFLGRSGFSVELYELTTDLGASVVMALLTYSSGALELPAGARIASSGAAFDAATAASKALFEAVQTIENLALHTAHGLSLEDASGPHLLHHIAGRGAAFTFLDDGPRLPCERCVLDEGRANLDGLAAAFERAGTELVYRVLTPAWLASTPVAVVEVWVPGLQPLDLTLPARRVLSNRLLAFGERAGSDRGALSGRALASAPHPLG